MQDFEHSGRPVPAAAQRQGDLKDTMVNSHNVLDEDGAPTHAPRVLFAAAAVRVGLIRFGDPLDQNLVDYALAIVTLAARIADRCTNAVCPEDTVGEAIRAHVFDM